MAGKPNSRWLETMVAKHGSREKVREIMQDIGARGGAAKVPKGFALDRENAARSGRKVGLVSKRGHRFIKSENGYNFYIALNTGMVVKYKGYEDTPERKSSDN